MSDIATPMNGARFDGLVTVEEHRASGMITLRGDFADTAFVSAIKTVTDLDLPAQLRVNSNGERQLLWMSPDELMLLSTYAEAPYLAQKLTEALAGQHALVANVSDARARFTLKGAATREVIAKLAPVDLSPEVFAVSDLRRTRFAQVAAAFWLSGENTAEIICFRSVGEYMFNLLTVAAQKGSGVGFFDTPKA